MLTESEILKFIEEDKASEKKRLASIGTRYYESNHDIKNYRAFYYNADGKLVEDKARTNIKISHPFFTELVDQSVQYILSNKGDIIKSKDPALQNKLKFYFDDDFNSQLADTLTGAISKGFEYMYTYIDKTGKICFECADSLGVVEVRAKDTDDNCSYIIYWYIDRIAKGNKKIKHIQVWDDKQVTFYVQEDGGKLMPDESEKINPRPHIIYYKNNDDSIYYDDFGFIPFFRLDNNKKQISSIKPIKDLIDDYDIMSCGLSNNLADFDNPLYIVRGFQGDNLDELQANLKTKKIIGIDDTGGIDIKTIDIPYQARQAKMQEDEKNIYRFGMGFNSAQLGDGNITNVVIKSRYALLDLKCNKLETRLRQFLKKLVKVVILQINKTNGTNYKLEDVYFDFTREIITNAEDNAQIEKIDAEKRQIQINTLLSLSNVLDNETIIKNICEVLGVDYEEIKNKLPVEDVYKENQTALDILEGV